MNKSRQDLEFPHEDKAPAGSAARENEDGPLRKKKELIED